jgi:putative transposase
MNFIRAYSPGGTFFFTVVTHQRQPIFSNPQAIETLRNAFRYTMGRFPFTIVASIILPDHMHFIWTLPKSDSNFSTRWRLIKSHFTRNWNKPTNTIKAIWQPRFWEHLIQSEQDLAHHIDYIHYNPVKHGLAKTPGEWKHSSFHTFVREGFYSPDWGAQVESWLITGDAE